MARTLDALLTLAGNAMPRGEQLAPYPSPFLDLFKISAQALDSAKVAREGKSVSLHAASDADLVALVKDVLLPAQKAARTAAARSVSMNNLKQIGLALHNYYSVNGHLPPAVVMGPDGKTPHSWRVEILPYLEQQQLYSRYKMDEPWDSPANLEVLKARPNVFGYAVGEGDPTETAYAVLTGPETMFPPGDKGTGFARVTDGLSNTIMVVEADRHIPWTKPDDIPLEKGQPVPKLGGFQPQQDGYNVLFGDGSVRFLKNSIDAQILRHLFTFNGGEVIGGF